MFTEHIVVDPWQIVLERDGGATRVLGPGRHEKQRRASYQFVDARERLTQVAPQEVLTADGVTVKVSCVLRWRVADAVAYTEIAEDPLAGVYLAVQVALREGLATLDAETLVRTGRAVVTQTATQVAVEAGRSVGIEVREVVVKDVVLPAELRAAYAELVTGRQRAQAQLEAARAETAALRSLANGAQLLDRHPALAQLRLVQALPYGSTVRLSTGQAVQPEEEATS